MLKEFCNTAPTTTIGWDDDILEYIPTAYLNDYGNHLGLKTTDSGTVREQVLGILAGRDWRCYVWGNLGKWVMTTPLYGFYLVITFQLTPHRNKPVPTLAGPNGLSGKPKSDKEKKKLLNVKTHLHYTATSVPGAPTLTPLALNKLKTIKDWS